MKVLHPLGLRLPPAAWLVALVVACNAGGAAAQPSAAEIEKGRQLYMSVGCYTCHGTVGQGGERSAGPRIAPGPHPVEIFKVFVRNAPEAMPRFDPRFVSDEQLEAIHRYLASIPKGRSAKDIPQLQPPG